MHSWILLTGNASKSAYSLSSQLGILSGLLVLIGFNFDSITGIWDTGSAGCASHGNWSRECGRWYHSSDSKRATLVTSANCWVDRWFKSHRLHTSILLLCTSALDLFSQHVPCCFYRNCLHAFLLQFTIISLESKFCQLGDIFVERFLPLLHERF